MASAQPHSTMNVDSEAGVPAPACHYRFARSCVDRSRAPIRERFVSLATWHILCFVAGLTNDYRSEGV